MHCSPEVLKQVPLFAGLDDEEAAVLAEQVEIKTFQPRQRIYKMGDAVQTMCRVYCPFISKNFSTSSAAMQPVPAAVIACR